jgi:hypothetical protein
MVFPPQKSAAVGARCAAAARYPFLSEERLTFASVLRLDWLISDSFPDRLLGSQTPPAERVA